MRTSTLGQPLCYYISCIDASAVRSAVLGVDIAFRKAEVLALFNTRADILQAD